MTTGRGDRGPTGVRVFSGRESVAIRESLLAKTAGVAVLCTALGMLAACGGSGSSTGSSGSDGGTASGDSGVSLSLSPSTISETASAGQTAPTATLMLYANGLQTGQEVYFQATYSENGIASLTNETTGSPIDVSIQFKSPAALGTGTYRDTINVSVCYDQACAHPVTGSPQSVQVTYTVEGSIEQLSTLSPSSVMAEGPAFTLTATGTNFTAQSQLDWNGSPLTTTFTSPTTLSAQVPASDIAAAGTASVTVNDPVNGVSNALTFTIAPAQLTLSSVSPTSVSAGGATFMLTVLGTGFSSSSVVQWNGSSRTTTFDSPSELIAQINAADIASTGTASVTVEDPTSSVGTTSPQTVTIAAPSKDAVAFQMNAQHSGAVTFNSVTLPPTTLWTSADLGGTPSYALIADGKVYLTVDASSGNSQLVALDQATGAIDWGPVAIAGATNAAYDNGTIFVISAQSSGAQMQAYDADTGAPKWSTLLTGQFFFSSGPTAADGFVFTGGAESGGTLYALPEATGGIAWMEEVANGDDSTPVVTADGVYVTYPCWTYDFRPATGESIWQNSTGCDGGGGGTPVAGNGVLYAPNGFGSYSGTTFNAETGASIGDYAADNPPAIGTQTGYFLNGGTLEAITLSSNTIVWSFAGDSQLNTSPILVQTPASSYVFIGSGSGMLYALNGATGATVWSVNVGAAFPRGAGWGAGIPLTGLAAGDGLLVVPAGTKVIAYTISTNP